MLSDRSLSVCLSCPVCLSCLSVTLVYCGQTVGWIKMKLGTAVEFGPGPHCVKWEPGSSQRAQPPISAHNCCGQMAGWIKMPLGMELGLGSGHVVKDGNPAPPLPKKGGRARPIFGPCLLWSNGWMDQGATWHGGRPRLRPRCDRYESSSPFQKGAQPPPQLSAYAYCGQAAGWIKMPLVMKVGLGPGNIVLDGDQAPPRKGAQ